jgi:exonuclease III
MSIYPFQRHDVDVLCLQESNSREATFAEDMDFGFVNSNSSRGCAILSKFPMKDG